MQAAEAVGAPGHRVLGTLGGNLCLDTRCIYYNQSEWWRSANGFCLKRHGDTCHVAPQGKRCHAAFTGDLAPALLALGATVEIAGTSGRRRMPLGDLYVEDGLAHLTLGTDELIVAVELPPDPPPSAYEKVRVRGAIDYPLAGVAVALGMADGVVASLRLALTGTNSRPFVLAGTDALVGRPVDEKALAATSTGWCRSRCSRCARRWPRRIIAAWPLPAWPSGWSGSCSCSELELLSIRGKFVENAYSGTTAVASSSIFPGASSRSLTKIMLIAG